MVTVGEERINMETDEVEGRVEQLGLESIGSNEAKQLFTMVRVLGIPHAQRPLKAISGHGTGFRKLGAVRGWATVCPCEMWAAPALHLLHATHPLLAGGTTLLPT